MKAPEDPFSGPDDIKRGFERFTNQFTPMRESIEKRAQRPQDSKMSDDKSDHKAAAGVSEAKIAATLEVIRRENSEAKAELKTAISAFQAENALFRETIRGFISAGQVENSLFREQIKEGISGIKVDAANHAKDVEGKISSTKQWVMAGAIAALVTAVTILAGAFFKQSGTPQPLPPTAASVSAPSAPNTVEVSVLSPASTPPQTTEKKHQAPPSVAPAKP